MLFFFLVLSGEDSLITRGSMKQANKQAEPICWPSRYESINYYSSTAAWAAANRAMGTRNGEQLT